MKSKIQIVLKPVLFSWLLAMPAAFTSCSSAPPSNTGPITTQAESPNEAGFGGELIVDTYATTNAVVSLDPAARKIELRRADGGTFTYTAGPDVVNYDKIKVGDRVRATVVDEIGISMIPASSPQQISETTVVARSKANGVVAGGRGLQTVTFTAKILSTNPWLNQVTLQLADGTTKTIPIRNDAINLANFNPGDNVRVRLTQALALLVEQP